MKLQKASIWIQNTFAHDSQPDLRTVKKWVRRNIVAGYVIEKQLYIDLDAFNTSAAKLEEFKQPTTNRFEFING